MLWQSYLNLSVSYIDYKRTYRSHRRPIVYKTIFYVVSTTASRAYQFLANQSASCKICVIKTTKSPCCVVHVVVFAHNNFICRMEFFFVKRIRNCNLNHLAIFKKVFWANYKLPVLLMLLFYRSFPYIRIDNLSHLKFIFLLSIVYFALVLKQICFICLLEFFRLLPCQFTLHNLFHIYLLSLLILKFFLHFSLL